MMKRADSYELANQAHQSIASARDISTYSECWFLFCLRFIRKSTAFREVTKSLKIEQIVSFYHYA